jgi:hypothetical protein
LRCGLGLGLLRQHADEAAAASLILEQHNAIDRGEQSVVFAAADVPAGLVARAALADQDGARVDHFAAESLDPEALALRIASIDRRTAAFLCAMGNPLF